MKRACSEGKSQCTELGESKAMCGEEGTVVGVAKLEMTLSACNPESAERDISAA